MRYFSGKRFERKSTNVHNTIQSVNGALSFVSHQVRISICLFIIKNNGVKEEPRRSSRFFSYDATWTNRRDGTYFWVSSQSRDTLNFVLCATQTEAFPLYLPLSFCATFLSDSPPQPPHHFRPIKLLPNLFNDHIYILI